MVQVNRPLDDKNLLYTTNTVAESPQRYVRGGCAFTFDFGEDALLCARGCGWDERLPVAVRKGKRRQ